MSTSTDSRTGYCMICLADSEPVRHINLYVIGSEGLDVCHHCEMQLVEHVRGLRSLASHVKITAMRKDRGGTIVKC